MYLSVLLLALVIKIVTANVRLQRSPQHYCGSKLADIMKALCNTKYNVPKGQKRSETGKFILHNLCLKNTLRFKLT